jgi:thioredoxin reductase
MARQFVSEVIIYSNGSTEVAENLNQIIKSGTNLRTDTRRIVGIRPEADERVTIAFDDGSTKTHKFLVYHPRTAVNVNMATDLGLELSPSGGEIKTSPPFNETNVPGCFAVGDAGSPMKALVLALGNGSLAGPGVVQQLVKQGKFSPSGNI